MTLPFDNSYARLPEAFFVPQQPEPVPEPALVVSNDALALRLGLDPDWLSGPEGLAMCAGNQMPDGAEPIAQAYAGHQFGVFFLNDNICLCDHVIGQFLNIFFALFCLIFRDFFLF